jgi:outer membrane receptor protein involved in Fe transport
LPKISLAVDLSSRVRGGVLVQRAYNPGGTTLRFDMGAPDNFAAEQLWDCELFLRANLPAGLSASANLFYEGVHDAQRASDILIFTPAGLGVGFSDLFNAHRARSSGAEANLEWRASRALTARFSLGLLRTRLIDGGPDHPELSGNSFARSPHLSASAAVDWTPTKQLHLSIQARHHSAFYAQDVNSPDVRIAPASILDIRAEYRIRRVNAFAYVRNLFNSFALLDREGSLRASAEDPRTIGMGIETRF